MGRGGPGRDRTVSGGVSWGGVGQDGVKGGGVGYGG